MGTMTKADKAERDEAIGRLREMVKPGDTLYTVLRHVARSGMSRGIDVHKIEGDTPHWLSRRIADATGFTFNEKRECLTVGGCGMDMGFHVVYSLSAALYPEGFGCIGEGCPSNDHSNGDRDYTPHTCNADAPESDNEYRNHHKHTPAPIARGKHGVCHWHRDGGYALRQRWI